MLRYSIDKLTPSRLDHLVNLVSSIHGAKIKQLHDRPGIGKLGSVIGRGSKLLEDLSPDAGGGLLHLDHGAVAEIAFNKKDHLIIPHQGLAAADVAQPPLHERLDTDFVLLCAGAGGGQRSRNGGNKRFGIGGYKVLRELDKL